MHQEVYRASRCFDLISARKNYEEINFDDDSSAHFAQNSYHQLFKFNYESLIYSIHDKIVVVADLQTGKSKCFKFNRSILPMIETTTASGHKITDAYLMTNTGILFALGIDGVSFTMKLPFVPTAFCQANDRFYFGKSTGEVVCIENDQVIFVANKPTSFLKSLINKIRPSNPIISMESFENSIYALTSDSKIYTIHADSGKIIETNTLWNSSCTSGTIRILYDSVVVILSNGSTSIIKVFKKLQQDFKTIFEMEFHNILDAAIGKDHITILQGDLPDVSICKYSLETKKYVATDWSPIDDYHMYTNYQFSTVEKFQIKDKNEISMIAPRSCAIDNNNFTYIASNSYVYILRPFYEVEKCLLFLKDEPQLTTLEGFATSLYRLLSKSVWSNIDSELRDGAKARTVFEKAVAELEITAPRELNQTEYINRFEEIIRLISIPHVSDDDFVKGTDINVFWASAVSQVIRAVSFFARALYLASLFLEKNNFHFGDRLNKLDDIISDYTKLSVAVDNNTLFDLKIFEPLDYTEPTFNEYLSRQIRQVLAPANVAHAMIESNHTSSVIPYLRNFEGSFIEYGHALMIMRRYQTAVSYFCDHYKSLDISNLYKYVIEELVKNDDVAAIKFCELVKELDVPYVSAILITLYCRNSMPDKALQICMSFKDDTEEKYDMIRMTMTEIAKTGNASLITRTDFGNLLTVVAKMISSLSIDTLPAAAILYQSKGELTDAIQSFYRYGREMLRMNSLEAMRKAMTSLSMALALYEGRTDVAPRDVCSKEVLSIEKLRRIVERLRVVLNHPSPLECAKLNNVELLRAAREQSIDTLVRFANFVPYTDVVPFISELVSKSDSSALTKILEMDKAEWNFSLHIAAISAYLKAKNDPPHWLIEESANKAKCQFILICTEMRAKSVVIEGLEIMKQKDTKLPPPMYNLLSTMGIEKELIEQVVDII